MFDAFTLYDFQQYLWMIVSFIWACLVFMLFVQWWQVLSLILSKNEKEKTEILNIISKRYEITFTNLVVFGGSMFAVFPLFYSTSFWGAYYVWFAILFLFIIEWVSFKYRTKMSNFLWNKTYEIFLFLNWFLAPLLLWVAVATFFTWSNFLVEKQNLIAIWEWSLTISSWTSPFHGLEALWNSSQWAYITNISLGMTLVFSSLILAALNLIKNVSKRKNIYKRAKRSLYFSVPVFLLFFLIFIFKLLTIDWFAYNPSTKEIYLEAYKYLNNFIEMPQFWILFLIWVVSFVSGIVLWYFDKGRVWFWTSWVWLLFVAFCLFCISWLNNTVFYPSLTEISHWLTIENASSSLYTLEIIAYSTFFIPFVFMYISYVWSSLTKVVVEEEY